MVSYGSVRAVEREGLTLTRVRRRVMLAAGVACVASVCLLGTVLVNHDEVVGTSLLEVFSHRYGAGRSPSWMAPVLSEPMLYAVHQPAAKGALAQQLAAISNLPSSLASEDPQEIKREADDVEAQRAELQREDEAMGLQERRLARQAGALRQARRDGHALPVATAPRAPPQAQQKAQAQQPGPRPVPSAQAVDRAEPAQPQPQIQQQQQQQQQQPQSFERVEGPMRWQPEMGTDISFISTDDFPKVMEGSWHTRAETARDQAEANQREAEIADSALARTVRAQAAELSQQREQISRLERDVEENREEEEARFYSQPPAQPAMGPPQQRKAATQQLRSTSGSLWPWKEDGGSAGAVAGGVSQFEKALSGFLGSGEQPNGHRLGGLGGMERVAGHQKALKPDPHPPGYEEEEHEEEEAEAAGELAGEEAAAAWEHPEQEGGPCNWPGACNRGVFEGKVGGRWAKARNERFMTPAEVKEMEAEEAEEEGTEAEAKEAQEDQRLKARWEDRIFGGSMDDFVPAEEAAHHNLLTTGVYGVDHFGKFPPFSKENNEVMYGRFYKITTNALGEPSQTEKGNVPGVQLGENGGKIGGADQLVAAKDSAPAFPTAHPHDQFADWAHDSAANQRMLHGRYWKELRRDGFFDRKVPAAAAAKAHNGGGLDRNVGDHVLDWSMYGPGEVERVHGKDYASKTFTGTDEAIEEGKGTVGSRSPYLKVAGGNVLRQLPRQAQGYPAVRYV